jgi:hypothetical protein
MSSSGGAGLLELVARGKKDTFFTGDPKISFFHSIYRRKSPWIRETRFITPRNDGDFNSYSDFVLDPVADLMRDIHLIINLPTWLPTDVATDNGTSIVRDLSGNAYGYSNHIGYYLLQKIQLYQNQVLLYEDYGEAMYLRTVAKSTLARMNIYDRLTGGHDGSTLSIQRAAAPGQIEVKLHLPCDTADFGIPIGSVKPFSLRLRVYLMPLDSVIESSANSLNPLPFNIPFTIQRTANGSPTQFTSKKKNDLGKPQLQLRVQHIYVDGESQRILKNSQWKIPFVRSVLNEYTLEDVVWKLSDLGLQASIRKRLELYGSAQRLRILFQSAANRSAGKLSNYAPITGDSWFTSLSLLVHGYDRLGVWHSDIFSRVTPYCHDVGRPLDYVYCLDAGAEDQGFPAGTLNFTEVEKPEMQIMLTDQAQDSRNGIKKSFMRVYTDVWNVLLLEDQWFKLPYL